MTADVCEIKCKMEVSLEDTPKPRAALFKEGEDDEPMASQNIPVENSCPVSNMVTGLLFGAFFYDEKYIKKAKEIFAPGGLSSMIIFKGATFKKKEDKSQENIFMLVL